MNYQCTGLHAHLEMKSQEPILRQAQVWTWNEAQLSVGGISLTMKAERREHTVEPMVETVRSKPSACPVFDPNVIHRAQPGVPQSGYDSQAQNDWTYAREIG